MARRRAGQGRWRWAALGLASLTTGCAGSVLDPAGPVGAADAQILILATVIMLGIVIPTLGMAFWFAWKYRASNTKAEYLPNWSYSGRIEAVVWSIPILTIMFIGGVIWIGSQQLEPSRPLPSRTPPLEVQVVSLDWKWLFIYPREGVATVNELVVPAGTPVRFSVTSGSVFNAFFVHQMGSMIYAMPGMVSRVNLQADRPAVLLGQSAHFSGDGFSDMQFRTVSLPANRYAAWVAAARASPLTLDGAAYAQLARQSHDVRPFAFGRIDPALFDAVATQRIAPAPGPQPEGPGHAGRECTPAGRS